MNPVVARRLRPYERQKLQKMKRQLSNAVNSRHARIILLSTGRVDNSQIASRCGCTPTWVRAIIHRFNSGGIDAITWYPYYCHRSGPRKFFAEITEQIAEVALSPPQQLIGMSVWSLSKLRAYLIQQRIIPGISLEQLRQILRSARIHWRHTKSWKESTDPQFWPKYRRIRRLYRHRPEGGRRLCIDEFGPLNLQPRHGMHYATVGHVDRLRATYSRRSGVCHMYGVYDLERDSLLGQFVAKKNGQTFLGFLKWVRRRYPEEEMLHIVLDNASFHLVEKTLAWARAHRIRFYWTPTGASWLNRIECHFAAMKKFALDNTDFRCHADQQIAIQQYLAWRNRRRKISLQRWNDYRHHQHHVQRIAA
jgi:transposase